MQLSEHFQLSEFTKSQTATRNDIDNTPSDKEVKALKALCENVLEKIRAQFGVVKVSSGYRNKQLNTAIGGSATSQHTKGEAADIEVPRISNKALAEWIATNCDFDQLILEFHVPSKGPDSGWVHVSWVGATANRKEVLRASRVKGKTVYTKGLK